MAAGTQWIGHSKSSGKAGGMATMILPDRMNPLQTALAFEPRIIALDDDASMRALFSIAFRNLPAKFAPAANEAEAALLIQQAPVDLLLVDIHLGTENGLDVSKRLLSGITRRVPVIAVTGESLSYLDSTLQSGL